MPEVELAQKEDAERVEDGGNDQTGVAVEHPQARTRMKSGTRITGSDTSSVEKIKRNISLHPSLPGERLTERHQQIRPTNLAAWLSFLRNVEAEMPLHYEELLWRHLSLGQTFGTLTKFWNFEKKRFGDT